METNLAYSFDSVSVQQLSIKNSGKITLNVYNRRQNELRHFAQKWAFLRFMNFKRRKYSFPPPSPPCNVVPLFQLPIENNKHPNFEWRGQGRGGDSFVLRSHPISVQCLNNFVADCSFLSAIRQITVESSNTVLCPDFWGRSPKIFQQPTLYNRPSQNYIYRHNAKQNEIAVIFYFSKAK